MNASIRSNAFAACFLLYGTLIGTAVGQGVSVSSKSEHVAIGNAHVRVEFDLTRGTYRIVDRQDGTVCIADAFWALDGWSSRDAGATHRWSERSARDELGVGRSIVLTSSTPHQPDRILDVTLYENRDWITMAAGIDNRTDRVIQLKRIEPLAGGGIFPGLDKSTNFRMLDGYGGGEPLQWGVKEYTAVHTSNRLLSRNNLLVTFGQGKTRRSLVLGGLTYTDYEKFAHVRQKRRTELAIGPDGKDSLLCYLNLTEDTQDALPNGPALRLVQGEFHQDLFYSAFWCPEFTAMAAGKDGVVIEASGLQRDRPYWLGFSWWNMNHRASRTPDRIQSIAVDSGPETARTVLLDRQTLPMWSNPKKEQPRQAEIKLPRDAYASGRLRILVASQTDDPVAVISEIWLRDGRAAALLDSQPTAIDTRPRPRRRHEAELYAEDPVGKRVDPGVRYVPRDRFYIDPITRNPFESLEQYGGCVRKAQHIDLPVYDFPTVCLWYANHRGYGGGKARNDTVGAVAEMEAIAKTGFLNYARAAVRLVPDNYQKNSQQGWWDDEHFRKLGSTNLGDFVGGQYKAPYETSEKWGKAVTERGGIPLIYFQTSFRSEDYCQAFPEHMLFNKSVAWKNPSRTFAPDNEKFWGSPWAKNGSLWSYDYTDPGFIAHLRKVYANLRSGGIRGLMFDYPASGWAAGGGMEDPYATTAAAYRNIFALAKEGLGPSCYVHERNMERGSDVSLGLVASQRTENDTDRIHPGVVTRCGLRWYKNRVVVNYDTDSKNLLRPSSRDGVRCLLTMSYITTGRLLLANSFTQLSPETLHDLTRIYPFHDTPRSARPVDALTAKYPCIYDFAVTPQWHQVTFYNTSREEKAEISVRLAGDTAEGALGLKPTAKYHVYDFWNDAYVGQIAGTQRLTQTLRPDEARMMSIHQVTTYPQFISTDRHLMQGYVDLHDVAWDVSSGTLKGTARVVAGETYKLVLAVNGYEPNSCSASAPEADVRLRLASRMPGNPLCELVIECDKNADVKWSVVFKAESEVNKTASEAGPQTGLVKKPKTEEFR